MNLYLNELSVCGKAVDRSEAARSMHSVVKVIQAAQKACSTRVMRTVRGLSALDIAPGYPLAAWLNDSAASVEAKQLLKAALTAGPYVENAIKDAEDEQEREILVEHKGRPALGLGAALLDDAIAISLNIDVDFIVDPVMVHVTMATASDVVDDDVEVCNIASEAQLTARSEWIKLRLLRDAAITSGADLIRKSDSVLPHLILCEQAVAFLVTQTGNEMHFRHVLRHLRKINDAMGLWKGGVMPPLGVKWSNEGEQTMKNPDLKAMRLFRCPDGKHRTMEPHSKLIGANIRIHFLPDLTIKKAYVGYIGEHLPVSSS